VREYIRIAQYALGLSPVLLFCRGSGILTQVAQDTKIMAFATLGTKPERLSSTEQSIWLSISDLARGRKTVTEVIVDVDRLINLALRHDHWSDRWFEMNAQFHPAPTQEDDSSATASGDPPTRSKRGQKPESGRKCKCKLSHHQKRRPTAPPFRPPKRHRATPYEQDDTPSLSTVHSPRPSELPETIQCAVEIDAQDDDIHRVSVYG
jgi:hypothetical protein